MASPPAPAVRRINEACDRHDLDEALAVLDNDIVFAATEPAPHGRCYSGRPAVAEALGPIEVGDRVRRRTAYHRHGGHVRALDLYRVSNDRIVEIFSHEKG